ncbi:RNA-binding region-containing protein 3 isoform X1 [Lethenteron reissneri]|uniref:RNA-binding region-containing protein 3 isoform X1 n=1 Tax=Lethenteron reissneri TaxID=7753 RepID=UPI002AB6534F|nr:RNA-binding region-containing protein 3 isoform X1 [Lethenteron reissneri]
MGETTRRAGGAPPPLREAAARGRRSLLVRRLPRALPADAERQRLLRHFGASDVRPAGKMRNAAFATFPSEAAAAKALRRLHQLEVLGSVLAVEFARDRDAASAREPPAPAPGRDKSTVGSHAESAPVPPKASQLDAIAPKLGVTYTANPLLRYRYPPPTTNILANICHALSSSPRFYTQVLHLMNKMNLPAPFGHVTSPPPLVADFAPVPPAALPQLPPLPPEEPPRDAERLPPAPPEPEEVEMEVSSDEESEYESEEDEHARRLKTMTDTAPALPKRPLGKKKISKRKRPKLQDLLVAPKAPVPGSQPALTPAQVFEQPALAVSRKIAISLPSRPPAHTAPHPASPVDPLGEREGKEEREGMEDVGMGAGEEGQGGGGFGKMFPAPACPSPNRTDDEGEEEEEQPSQFISRKELSSGRVSREEMAKSSVFKNYSAGEPTCRLYVKNLSRQVSEQDLKHIFGRYVDFSSDVEKNMFDVRLMREGRMKGQAFVGLPSEREAQKALRDAHGYVLHGRPLVIQFARSARPKEEPKVGKKKSSLDAVTSNHPG